MRAFDIDTQIDEIIEKKKQNSHAVVDGTSPNNNMISNAAKISIFQLVASIVPKITTTTLLPPEGNPSSSNNETWNGYYEKKHANTCKRA